MKEFKAFLIRQNLSSNTINAYIVAVKDFNKKHNVITKNNLLLFKSYCIENFKPSSVNLKIHAINRYLDYLKKSNLRLKYVKIQQKTFIENIISDADYIFFKRKLKLLDNKMWYFVVRFLACTGARISELRKIKIEDVRKGYVDLYTKGGKIRRIYIPLLLVKETTKWIEEKKLVGGYLFLNRYGKQITARGISQQLKELAIKYGLNSKVVYPHSFRHRFAKNFLEKYNDIALLADLMGHESIETTRIYLRKSSLEQQEIVNKIVTW